MLRQTEVFRGKRWLQNSLLLVPYIIYRCIIRVGSTDISCAVERPRRGLLHAAGSSHSQPQPVRYSYRVVLLTARHPDYVTSAKAAAAGRLLVVPLARCS